MKYSYVFSNPSLDNTGTSSPSLCNDLTLPEPGNYEGGGFVNMPELNLDSTPYIAATLTATIAVTNAVKYG